MNLLVGTIRNSLTELELGISGSGPRAKNVGGFSKKGCLGTAGIDQNPTSRDNLWAAP